MRTASVVRADASNWLIRLNTVLNRPAVALSLLAAFAMATGLTYLLLPPASPLLNGDTPDYLYFDAGRPIGYPIFLRVISLLTGGYEAVRPVQILLFVLSAFVASWAVFRHGWGFMAAFIFELGVLGYPGPIGLADSIMSDSVAASLYLLYLAAVLGFVRRPTPGRYFSACLVMALSITVRPVGVALIASNLALLLLYRRDLHGKFLPASGLLLVLALAGWFATPVTHSFVSGEKAGTPLARGLLQKVIFEQPKAGRAPSCDDEFIESLTLPALRYIQAAPEQQRDMLRLRYSSYLRFKSIIPGLVQRHDLKREADADPILMCYSLARIRENPLSFLQVTVQDYWNLVINHTFITKEEQDSYNAFIATHPPVLPPAFANTRRHSEMRERAARETSPGDTVVASEFIADEVSFEPSRARPAAIIVLLKLIQVAATLAGFVCIVLVCLRLMGFRTAEDWVTLGVVAMAAQFSLLLTAIVEMALPRYMFPVWPYYWLTIVFLSLWAWRKAFGRRPPRWASR